MDGGTGRQAVSQTSVSSDEVNNSITQPSENVNTDEGLIYETLVQMGVHKGAAQSLARQFDAADGLSAEVYAKGVGESFLYGIVADLIRAQQAKAKEHGRTLTWMQAYEEMVADSLESMLTDGKVMEKLALLKKKDKSLVQKIKEWFREFAAKLRRAYETAAPDTREGQMVAEMVDEIDRIQELFAEGLAEAGARYKVLHGQKK